MLGFTIIEDRSMVEPAEDWSQVRSPARAERRRKRGFPQRIRHYLKPKPDVYRFGDKLVMHPDIAAELRRQIATPSKDPHP